MRASPWKVLTVVLIIVALLALGYGTYLWFFSPKSARLASFGWGNVVAAVVGPRDLKGASFLLSLGNGGLVYRDGGFDSREYAVGKDTVDYVEVANAVWLTTYDRKTKTYALSKDHQVLVSSKLPIQSLSVAPSGNAYVYARMKEGTLVVNDHRNWEVVVVEGTEERILGEGFSAVFLDENTLLHFTARAVYLEKTDGTKLANYIASFPIATGLKVAQDDERSLVAWTSGASAAVYQVDVAGKALSKIFEVQVGSISSLALSKDALYAISPNEKNGSSVTRFGFDGETKVVRSFPAMTAVVKMQLHP